MMEQAPGTVLCSATAIRAQAVLILAAWGMDAEDAATTAEALTDCDLRGIETHGISLLALYAQWMKERPFNFAAKPRIEREGLCFALLDAQGGLGYPVSVRAMQLAVEKARASGLAAVAVRGSSHFGAAGYYARLGARAGMVTLATTSTRLVCVVPPGSAAPMLGTNPLAYGIPRGQGEPIVFDMATSTAAGNKIRMRALKDLPLPEGWVVDAQGAPVTDPHLGTDIVYRTGAGGLTPLGANSQLGSHKGYGLALMAHFFGGVLAGEMLASSPRRSSGGPQNVGHFFLAIDPSIYRDIDAFHADVEDVAETLRGSPPLDPGQPVMMPGDMESRAFAERSRDGVPLPMTLIRQLAALSRAFGVPFNLAPADGGHS